MTKRSRCSHCFRPQATCLCHLAQTITTSSKLIVLQHPGETKHALNTAHLAKLCLPKLDIWSHCDFNQDERLNTLIAGTPGPYLLFPQEDALTLDSSSVTSALFDPSAPIIILDGTWRKCYRILRSTPALQCLTAIQFEPAEKSNYRIRKSPNEQALSTIEAIYSLLSLIEQDSNKFRPLLTIFNAMIEQQISYMGQETYQKNYIDK